MSKPLLLVSQSDDGAVEVSMPPLPPAEMARLAGAVVAYVVGYGVDPELIELAAKHFVDKYGPMQSVPMPFVLSGGRG